MIHCTRQPLRFSRRRGRKVEASFQGGAITGNGGVRGLHPAGLHPEGQAYRLASIPQGQNCTRNSDYISN